MFVAFGYGKCPFCGDFGQEVEKEIFLCSKCDLAFNEFGISSISNPPEDEDRFWN